MGWLCASTHLPHPPLRFPCVPAFNATALQRKKGGKALSHHYRPLYTTLTRVKPGWGVCGRHANVWRPDLESIDPHLSASREAAAVLMNWDPWGRHYDSP